MELFVAVFAALAVISATILGIVGVFTHWPNKYSVAIWAGYFTIVFALTSVFLVWQKRIWEDGNRPPTERPNLFVERVVARPLVAGHRKAVSVQLRNNGPKAAREITVWINQAFTKADFQGPLKFERLVKPDTRPDCAAGAAVSLAGKSDAPVGLWEIKALNDKKAFWFHYGKGTYNDDDGNTYPLSFCYMYEPGMGEDMVICPDRFWPKYDAQPPEANVPRGHLTIIGIQPLPPKLAVGQKAFEVITWGNDGDALIEITGGFIQNFVSFYRPSEVVIHCQRPEEGTSDIIPIEIGRIPRTQKYTNTDANVFNQVQVKAVNEGKAFFGVCGQVNYTTASRVYTFDFCSYYDPDEKAYVECKKERN